MKNSFFVLLLSCLSCFAQFPYSGTTWSKAPSKSTFEPTNAAPGLFLEFVTDSPLSLTNTVNGSLINGWTNLAPGIWGGLGISYLQRVQTIGPTYVTSGPSAGIGAIDFFNSTSGIPGVASTLKYLQLNDNLGTNQPMTWYFVTKIPAAWDTNLANGNLFGDITDTINFGRALHTLDGIDGYAFSYTGTGFGGANGSLTTISNWFCVAYIDNGASSSIYTNGVLYATGNSGTQSVGELVMGIDRTAVTQFMGQVACMLAYGGAHSAGTVATISTGLKTRFGY